MSEEIVTQSPPPEVTETASDVLPAAASARPGELAATAPAERSDRQSQADADPKKQYSRLTPEVSQPPQAKRPRRPKKLAIITLVILVLVLNGTMLGSSLYLRRSTRTAIVVPTASVHNNVSSASVQRTKSTVTASTAGAQPTTLHYVSTALNLEFDYPIDWRVDAAADSSAINLSSGKINFTDYSGVNTSGTISVNIQAKPTDSSDTTFAGQYFSGSELIAADSQMLSYLSPTSVQRKSTNLSYVQNQTFTDPATSRANLDASDLLLVSGRVAFKKGQKITDQDLHSVDPQISAYINDCPEIKCQYAAYAAVTQSTWQNDPNLSKIQDLIKSIRITK